MKVYEKILKLIEETNGVDPQQLHEIDGRVWCYLNGYNFAGVRHDRIYKVDEFQCEIEIFNGVCKLKYSSSRDALKKIRPKDYILEVCTANSWGTASLSGINNENFIECPFVCSEEMAELHVIIQAIAKERGEM